MTLITSCVSCVEVFLWKIIPAHIAHLVALNSAPFVISGHQTELLVPVLSLELG